MTLVRRPGVLAGLVEARGSATTVIVGFAAETGDGEPPCSSTDGRSWLATGCDLLVVNEVGVGVTLGGSDTVAVLERGARHVTDIGPATKLEVAHAVWTPSPTSSDARGDSSRREAGGWSAPVCGWVGVSGGPGLGLARAPRHAVRLVRTLIVHRRVVFRGLGCRVVAVGLATASLLSTEAQLPGPARRPLPGPAGGSVGIAAAASRAVTAAGPPRVASMLRTLLSWAI